jgi:membrane protein implicated in regulation of membrane protease activity
MIVFTTTRICTSAGIIPRWFAALGVTVGVVMLLTSSFNRWMIVVFPIWVLVLCLLTQLHVRKLLQQRKVAFANARAHTD